MNDWPERVKEIRGEIIAALINGGMNLTEVKAMLDDTRELKALNDLAIATYATELAAAQMVA